MKLTMLIKKIVYCVNMMVLELLRKFLTPTIRVAIIIIRYIMTELNCNYAGNVLYFVPTVKHGRNL